MIIMIKYRWGKANVAEYNKTSVKSVANARFVQKPEKSNIKTHEINSLAYFYFL